VLRVTADSNVYVSALNFGGVPRAVVGLAAEGTFDLYASAHIFSEVSRVLIEKLGWPDARLEAALETLRLFVRTLRPQLSLAGICQDPDDHRILECALEADAHLIVSGDSDLRLLGNFHGIRILSPRQFLDSRPWETEHLQR